MNTTFTSRARWSLAALAGAVVLAACGSDPVPVAEAPDPQPAAATEPAPATSAPEPVASAPQDAAVKISQTELGDVLADPTGKTLYAFTNDVEAASTCYGTCAEAWPPIVVDPDFIVSPGLDIGIFATTVRDDGSHQLVAGKYPLYLFAADAKPGDVTGHGSGDVWFAVDLQGRIIDAATDSAAPADGESDADATTDAATDATSDATSDEASEGDGSGGAYGDTALEIAALVQLGDSEVGPIVTDPDGLTLYLFTPDEAGLPTCAGGCAGTWPPYLVDGVTDLVAGDGIDAELSTVEHPDGGMQLKIGRWPAYYFAADQAPGDITGQGSGDAWFVVAGDGTAIR